MRLGLWVDEVLDIQEIVVKPLHPKIRSIGYYAGVTILGTGQAILILEPKGLLSGLNWEQNALKGLEGKSESVPPPENMQRFLQAELNSGAMVGIPFEKVKHLGRIDPEKIESNGNGSVIQFRDAILQLVEVDSLLPERRVIKRQEEKKGMLTKIHMAVCESSDGQSFGFLLHKIRHVLDVPVDKMLPASREGVLYSVVMLGKVTEILDLAALSKMNGNQNTFV
jgi:two-component system chemotaxis sensor kinase CheA